MNVPCPICGAECMICDAEGVRTTECGECSYTAEESLIGVRRGAYIEFPARPRAQPRKNPSSRYREIINARAAQLSAVLPGDVALAQARWELRQKIVAARRHATLAELASSLRITKERVRQLEQQGRHKRYARAPIERYLSEPMFV